MKERAYTFGEGNILVGVVTEPDADRRIEGAPAVVMANVGINHRVGPFRLYVDLARRLVDEGFTVLRFDTSGLGDSEMRRDGGENTERANTDMREAFDFLRTKKNIPSVVVLGACSGVDAAHALAATDSRVVGGVFIDGYAYPTAEYHARHYKRRLTQPRRWHFMLKKRAERYATRLRGGRTQTVLAEAAQIFSREYPAPEKFRADLKTMIDRGAYALFVYSGGVEYGYNHASQFYAMVKPLECRHAIDVAYMPWADHVFSRTFDRDELMNRIQRFMRDRFKK